MTGARSIGRSAAPSVRHQKETDARLIPTVCPSVDSPPATGRRGAAGVGYPGVLRPPCHRRPYAVFPERDRPGTLIRQGPLAGPVPRGRGDGHVRLIPYLALSAALSPLTPIIAEQLHMSLQTMSLAGGLANAAYAVGTVLAVQFAQHLPQRRMMVGYAVLLRRRARCSRQRRRMRACSSWAT